MKPICIHLLVRKLLGFCALLIVTVASRGQGKFIQLNKEKYLQGDTLTIACNIPAYKTEGIKYATLLLLVEEINTKKSWNFRYPLMEGVCNAKLAIDSAMKDGKYAFSFATEKRFFSLSGSLETGEQMDLNYAMLTRNGATLFDQLKTDMNGGFSLKGLLFEDTCYFVFTPPPTSKTVGLKLDIVTPLDSAVKADMRQTEIIALGNHAEPITAADRLYSAPISSFIVTTLPDVVVSTTKKRKVELFDEEFSTGLFKNSNARIIDGLENNRIAQSGSIINFLKGAVAGLKIMQSGGNYILQWRGISSFQSSTASNVDVFVDEFLLTQVTDGFVNPVDVAMIKAYPPPAFLTPGGQRGAIVIYTKRGGYDNENLFRNKFKVFGYSSLEGDWK